jgi:hypothetical protein
MDGWMKRKGSAMGDGGLGSAGQDPAAKIRREMEGRMAITEIQRPKPAGRSFSKKLSASAAGLEVGSRSGRGWPGWSAKGRAGRTGLGLVRPVGGGSGALSSVTVDDVGSSDNSKSQSSAIY